MYAQKSFRKIIYYSTVLLYKKLFLQKVRLITNYFLNFKPKSLIMRKILFSIPIILFFLIVVYTDFFEKNPEFIYTCVAVSFISAITGFYMEYKNNQETFREKYLYRILIGAFFIIATWSVSLYEMFSIP